MDAMPEERWLPVVGWEGLYEVSDQGRVKSLARTAIRRNDDARTPIAGRILKPGLQKTGYRMVNLHDAGQRTTRHVHRLVLDAFIGPLPDGFVSCHNNGHPGDNRLENLRYDTPSANNFDRVRHGRDHNTQKTHCPNGHEYTPENLVRSRPGRRNCLTCHRRIAREYQRRRRAAQKGEDHGST